MRTRSRSRTGWATAWALAVVVGAPALAHAQQGGLMPLHPIRRERVPCPMEDPTFRLYRQEYYGYHPTCWRRFPAGWGCPSPEAPDAAASFRERKRDPLPQEYSPDAGPEGQPGAETEDMPGAARPAPGAANPRTPNQNALPPLPSERSPFDLDNKPGDPPAADSPPAGRAAPPAERPNDGGSGLPPVNEPTAPTTTPAPVAPSPRPPAAPGASRDGRAEAPLLALPDPTVNPSSGLSAPNEPGPATTRTAGEAPRRTSIMSSLFSGRAFRRR